MGKGRVEAFSDGVLAIILTIMVLELKVPRLLESQVNSWESLIPLLPIFMSYLLSFIYVGIYWTNHHHLLHATHRITGGILWANMHLLFWLSLIPFTTALVGLNHLESMPTALYGLVLLLNRAGLLHLRGHHPRGRRARFCPGGSGWQSLERGRLADCLCGGRWDRVCASLHRTWHLCAGRDCLARS